MALRWGSSGNFSPETTYRSQPVAIREHPYLRLAHQRGFVLLWAGQLVSLFGDRIHQMALIMVVVSLGSSSLAMAAVFSAATLPTIILGPVLGAFVDRVDQRKLLIAMDLLRAALVALIPAAVAISFWLAIPLLLVIGTASAAFSPARFAVVSRAVAKEDLAAGNASLMTADNLADLAGYPLAGAAVVILAANLPLAFYLDALSYVVSAVAIIRAGARLAEPIPAPPAALAVRAQMSEAWDFLRGERALFANAMQGVLCSASTGVCVVLLPLYATALLANGTNVAPGFAVGATQTGLGAGLVLGSVIVGGIGHRVRAGRLSIFGYVSSGLLIALFAVSGTLWVAVPVVVAGGIANMVYLVPSYALVAKRVPAAMMGRVFALRRAMIGVAYLLGMQVAGLLGSPFGFGSVLLVTGILTMFAGGLGAFFPQVRDAD
jgi:DHA3 family macrolide efflux protein-like MFS transporter